MHSCQHFVFYLVCIGDGSSSNMRPSHILYYLLYRVVQSVYNDVKLSDLTIKGFR